MIFLQTVLPVADSSSKKTASTQGTGTPHSQPPHKRPNRPSPLRLWAVLFWLLVWQLGSMALDSQILLVSPVQVLLRLARLLPTVSFWSAVAFSFCRIAGGFLLATASGILLAALSARFRRVEELLAPAVLTIKSVPVASFIILALIWFSSRNLAVLISFLMVLPVIYTNVLGGIRAADRELLEMAQVFRIPAPRRIRYVYIPQVLPFFRSACGVALGLCWKSGIAAEVIGMPDGSIGERLQQAKVYLDTPDLFAWTFVIVCVSLAFEKGFLALLTAAERQLRQMHRKKSADSWDAPASGTSASSDTATASEAAAADLGDASSSRLLTASSSGNGEKNAPGIRLTHLCKAYDGKPVLQDFCALLPYGQTTAVMAPSGAGKTTLLRLLLGLEQPDSGQIEGLDGLRPAAVFQEDRLCASLTADANIRLITPSLTRAEALAAMEEIGLSDCGDQPVSEFSGGMRRRVALLRALLSDCDVLFLDEPFKGLDDTSKALVMEDTRRRAKGRTVLLVTHDLSEAQALGARVIHIGTNCAEGNRTETE